MKDLFYETIGGEMKPVRPKPSNPLHKLYGVLEGKKCGECKYHKFKLMSKKYPKCLKRKITASQSSDHSSRFTACGKFEPKEK